MPSTYSYKSFSRSCTAIWSGKLSSQFPYVLLSEAILDCASMMCVERHDNGKLSDEGTNMRY